jgi:hypothetical protein
MPRSLTIRSGRVKRLARDLWTRLPSAVKRGTKRAYTRLPATLQTTVRERVIWPTSREAEMTRAYVERHGLTVRRGPFQGLTYPADLVGRVDALVPKLIGSYEAELHPALERLQTRSVVNIGSADGYYAVGLTRRGSSVRAFDSDRTARKVSTRLAEANGVALTTGGTVTPTTLGHLAGELIVCDCEGCEATVLNPDSLRDCSLIVELHDFVKPGVGDEVIQRFSATHEIEIVDQEARNPAEFPEVQELPHAALALEEGRPEPMRWAVMTPRP